MKPTDATIFILIIVVSLMISFFFIWNDITTRLSHLLTSLPHLQQLSSSAKNLLSTP
jgi:hypothetical protein